MSRSSRNRFRPFNQFISSGSRAARQATKALLRANRNDAKWMARYQERQARIARWKANFGRFIPLNITRFRAVVGMFMNVVASLCCGRTLRTRPAFANRSGMINFGGKRKNRKSTRAKSKQNSSSGYEALEPRQLLAGDLVQTQLDTAAQAAQQRWVDSGLSTAQIQALDSVTYSVADLSTGKLGEASGFNVVIDTDAAGQGWFVDSTPLQDEEFSANLHAIT